MSATELLYYLDPSTVGSGTAIMVGMDGDLGYVVLDRTLFHPVGGGQKSDLGSIGGVSVARVERRQGEIFHLLSAEPTFDVGSVVPIEVDSGVRDLNSRYHSAGHLVGSVVERVLKCTAVSGQHWPGESFMRFEREIAPTEEQLHQCRSLIEEAVRNDRPVSIEMSGPTRLVTIEGFDPVPCGGTHVSRVGSIGAVELGTPRVKQRRLQISYRLAADGAAATVVADTQ